MERVVKVILLLDVSGEFDRKLLRGIVRYSQEHGPWQFYRMPSWFRWDANGEKHILEWARKWKADAIVGRWNSLRAPLLKSLGIPIVLQNYQTRSTTYSNLTGDYLGTGRMAARFFRKRLFSHFAYFGLKGIIWSEERRQGFVEELGADVSVLEISDNQAAARKSIVRWLHSLPKPVALFCCDDAHALLISEICKLESIAVPEEIALLGVDNDELYCAISDPPISSIELNEEQGGYLICSQLHRQILSGTNEPFSVTITPKCIIERQSTDRHNISDSYVAAIVRHLSEHFREDLSVDDIVKLVPLSKRSVELRFRSVMGTTLYQYLTQLRIEHFTRLLVTTDRALEDIAIESVFKDGSNMSRIFRRYQGCSPSEYRKKFFAF